MAKSFAMSLSDAFSEWYASIAKHLRFSDTVVLIISTSFITYRIFKSFEPDKPIPVGFLLVVIPSLLIPAVHPHAPSLSLAVVTTFVSYYSLIILCVATYRLSPFHPLAKYPGPIQNKLSKLTVAYVTSTGKQHVYYNNLHKQYGDIVRVGPNEVSVNRPDAIHPVLGAGGLPKGPSWYNRVPEGQPRGIIAIRNPVEHKQRRRLWDRAFNSAALKNYDEVVVKRTRELIGQFEKRAGQEIDLSMWMSYFSYDFMGDMAFGTGFGLMRSGYDINGVWHTLDSGLKALAVLAHVPYLFTYVRLIPGATKAPARVFAMAAEYVDRRVREGSNIKDLFYHLIDEEGLDPVKPSMSVVHSDGLLAVVAGSDTTATAITALWYYLILDPPKFDRLRNEVDAYFPQGDEPLEFARMVNMPYLNACINEALRLVPPVISGSQRYTEPGSGGKMVGPYFIPEGNQVINHTYTLQRDPRYFSPWSDSFWPDRWLPEEDRQKIPPNERFILDLTAFHPFSYGPANCVGKNLALLEMRAITCFIVQKFKFKAKDGFKMEYWEEGIEDFFVVKRPSLPVIVEVRQ